MAIPPQVPQGQVTNVKPETKIDMLKGRLLIVAILIAACVLLTVGFVIGYSISGGGGQGVTPTPTLIITDTPEPSATPSPTPTEVEVTDDTYDGWTQYVLADCQIKLFAPPDWASGKRGEQQTCGSFILGDGQGFDNFDTFNGVNVVFVPVVSEQDSIYGIKGNTISDFLSYVENNKDSDRDEVDKLVGEINEKFDLAGLEATQVVVDRHLLGTAVHVLYEIYGREYMIIWGGLDVEENQETLDLMLKSIEFLQPLEN